MNDGKNFAVFCKLLCVIWYVLNTKNHGLKLDPSRDASKPLGIVCFGGGDYSGDTIGRRSLKWFYYVCFRCTGILVIKVQQSMMLSSSEAQWVALVVFMIQLLRSMKISVKLPVMVRVDNVSHIHGDQYHYHITYKQIDIR